MDIFVGERIVARSFALVTLLLVAGAAVSAALSAWVTMTAMLAIAVTPAFVWLILHLIARRFERAAVALVASDAQPRWEYDAKEWEGYLESTAKSRWRVPLILAAVFALSGVAIAVVDGSDDRPSPSATPPMAPATRWTVFPLGGLVLGGAVAVAIVVAGNVIRDRRRRTKPIFVMGTNGLYLSGTYRPFTEYGSRLTGLTLEGSDLVFAFWAGRGGVQTLRVPVPARHRAAAERLAEGTHG